MKVDDRLVERVQRVVAGFGTAPTAAEIARIVREEAGVISDEQLVEVLRRLRSDSVGVGPLEPLLSLPGVTDVLVSGAGNVWIDRGSGLERMTVDLGPEVAVRRLATRLALSCGRRLDDAQPFADGRLFRDDGSVVRVHAILAPLSDSGTCISLRVLRQARLTLEDLVARGAVPPEITGVLHRVIEHRVAFLIVGGTGSGKTTLLSAMLAAIPHDQRIICIEDTAELQPPHPNVVSLVSRAANVEGAGEVSMAELLRQSLRMRPDRIVVGEIRGAEVVDLLAALNTGHEGGAGTVHANSIAEVPARMEALAARGGIDARALHTQLAAALELVLVMRHGGSGRHLAQIGLLHGNPVEARVVWDHRTGFCEEEVPPWLW
ncbi:TadA family conjugal transfer-associated ATPase [Corynebacterium pacaense]|uniref:TadA family conjugal transfer-associated ATPase n=1 Tax=Corynebacterium pacaense TaxID=1816684 RepID=UPI0009BB8346|nr:TadA family conjugal transfer-associated ATPase [Corynebacterium pacaense]